MAQGGSEMICRRCNKKKRAKKRLSFSMLQPFVPRSTNSQRPFARKHVTTHLQKQNPSVHDASLSIPKCLLVRCPASPQRSCEQSACLPVESSKQVVSSIPKSFPAAFFSAAVLPDHDDFAAIEIAITFYANGKKKIN